MSRHSARTFRIAFAAALGIVLLAGASARSRQEVPTTVVILVRHAEKAAGSGDVPLSPEGEARARDLSAIARNAGVNAVVTTQYRRTRQTAEPLVAALHLEPEVVAASGDVAANATATADVIRRRLGGRTVLVVGHSNTIPAIVAALGGTKYPDICDAEYDALFVVVISAGAPPRTIRSRYGAASPREGCQAMK